VISLQYLQNVKAFDIWFSLMVPAIEALLRSVRGISNFEG